MYDLISVIVPVYNVEKYLNRCVESILKQDYENIEVILVDDGSTDNSGCMCDFFQKKYPNKIYCYHKKNGGLSDARNYGIKYSNGKYIVFVDSDDWIEKNTIKKAHNEILQQNADIVVYGISIDNDTGTVKNKVPKKKEVLNSDEGIIYLNSFKSIDVSACNKMFNRKLFDNVEFPFGKLCEDCYIMYKLFEKAYKIVIMPQVFYHYYQRQNSIVRNSEINMDYIYAAKEEMEYLNKYCPSIAYAGKTGYAFAIITMYHMKYSRNINIDKKSLVEEMKKYRQAVLNNKYLSVFRKIQYIVFTYMMPIYNLWLKNKK